MEHIQRLEEGFLRATQSGDTESAQILGRELRRIQAEGAQAQEATPQETPPPDARPSAGYEAVEQFGSGFNRGLYGLANAPTAIANLGSRLVGSDFRFKRPLEAIAPDADKAIMQRKKAHTAAGMLSGTIGEYVGGNVLPAAGVIAAAPRIAAATAGATGTFKGAVNRMASGVAAAPATAAIGEVASSVGAGTGATVAKSVYPDSPRAELIGSLIGGVGVPLAASVIPANLARKAYGGIKKRVSNKAIKSHVDESIGRQFANEITPDTLKSIKKTEKLRKEIPGYNPSVADSTESPGIIATQQKYERGLSGAALDDAAARYTQNDRAVAAAVADAAPKTKTTLDGVFNAARNRVSRATAGVDEGVKKADVAVEKVAESLTSGTRLKELGRTIRSEILKAQAAAKADMNDLAAQYGLNASDTKYSFPKAVKDELKASVELRSKATDASVRPAGVISGIEALDDNVSITDLMEVRSRITTAIRTAGSRPDGGIPQKAYLEKLKSAFDDVSDRIIRDAGDDTTADNWISFRKDYLENYVERFERGAIDKTLKTDHGDFRVVDEKIAKEFFDGWGQSASEQFKRVFGEGSTASATMEAAAMDDLHTFATRNGVFDPSRVAAWQRQKAGVMGDFPGIQQKVSSVEDALTAISARKASLLARQKKIDRSYLAREIEQLDSPLTGKTPEAIVDAAFSNPKRMAKLMGATKNKKARKAIARHIWDTALGSKSPIEYLSANKSSAKMALGPYYKRAVKLATAIEKNKTVRRPTGQGVDTNPLAEFEKKMGFNIPQVGNYGFGIKGGRVPARFVALLMLSKRFNANAKNHADKLLSEALYDPDIAADLATAYYGRALPVHKASRLYTYMLSSGVIAATNASENEGERVAP